MSIYYMFRVMVGESDLRARDSFRIFYRAYRVAGCHLLNYGDDIPQSAKLRRLLLQHKRQSNARTSHLITR